MSETVEQYQFRFEAQIEGSREEFEQFMEKTKSETCERLASAKVLRKWSEKFQEVRNAMDRQLKEVRQTE